MTSPANTTGTNDTTLYYGDLKAPHEVQLFLEMRDRGSAEVAKTLLDTIREGADAGRYVVKFHFAEQIDDTVGGSGSQRAVSALAAASDQGQQQFIEYLAALFEAQPFPPGEDKFSEASVLLSVADKVDGLRSDSFDQKITDNTYLTWAGESIGDFGSFGIVGTPGCWYDQENIPVVTIEGDVDITPQKFLNDIK